MGKDEKLSWVFVFWLQIKTHFACFVQNCASSLGFVIISRTRQNLHWATNHNRLSQRALRIAKTDSLFIRILPLRQTRRHANRARPPIGKLSTGLGEWWWWVRGGRGNGGWEGVNGEGIWEGVKILSQCFSICRAGRICLLHFPLN